MTIYEILESAIKDGRKIRRNGWGEGDFIQYNYAIGRFYDEDGDDFSFGTIFSYPTCWEFAPEGTTFSKLQIGQEFKYGRLPSHIVLCKVNTFHGYNALGSDGVARKMIEEDRVTFC